MTTKVNFHLDVVQPDGDRERIDFGPAGTALVSNGPTVLPSFQAVGVFVTEIEDDTDFVNVVDPTKKWRFDGSAISPGVTRVIGIQDTDGTMALLADITGVFLDTDFTLQDNGNPTAQAQFELSGLTPGLTRTYTLQDTDGTVAHLADITAGAAPIAAQYLTLVADATLTVERVFTPGTALAAVDSGAGLAYTLNLADTAVTPAAYTNTSLTVDQQGRITAASSGATPSTFNTAFITANRTFPDVGNEGVATIGALNALSMRVTIFGGGGAGGGGSGGTSSGGGGSGSAVVGKPIETLQLAVLSATTFTVVIGAGGVGASGNGNDGNDSTFISQDGDNIVSLTGYGGGGGEIDDNFGGGGGGTGGTAVSSTGGVSNNIGGAAGPTGQFNATGGDQTGIWHTGWGGGGNVGAEVGSDWPNRSVGGALSGVASGGAGGFNGDGANGNVSPGDSAAANSGAGGGGAVTLNASSGSGGSGGCLVEWWT